MKAIVVHEYGGPEVLTFEDYADPVAGEGPVDIVANAVRGKTAERLLGKVKQGGIFASVTGAPENAKDYPFIRVVPFVSKQDTKTLLYTAQAVRNGKLVIPIHRKLPLGGAAKGHAAVEKDGIGKVLLLA